ncbi:MAG: alpha/beta fold hydrolase, partial [Haloferacaceae archaeon]
MPTTDPTADLTTRTCSLPDGRTLAYAVAGDPDGAPVVAHHGTPGSRLFAALLAAAARETGVRLVVPDRPGYGRSDPPPDGWSWADWPAAFEALAAAESLDRVAALGFSGGGPFALAAGTRDRTTRVALVSALAPPTAGGLA